MRLIYVTAGFPTGSGEAFFAAEIEALRELGHDVRIVPIRGRGHVVHDDAQALLRFAVVRPLLDATIAWTALTEFARRPRPVVAALGAVVRARSVRIALKNLAVAPKALWLAALARTLRAEHIHAHWAGTTASAALIASRVSGAPWSFTAHRWDIDEDNVLGRKTAEAAFSRAIDRLGAEQVEAHASSGTEVLVVHMGVPLGQPPPFSQDDEGRPLRVLAAGNLVDKKGHDVLVDAAGLLGARGTPVSVEIVGGGPLHERLQSRIDASSLGDVVRLAGPMPHGRLLGELAGGRWDVVAQPSVVLPDGETEGIPVTLLEAMAHGVPVVASAIGGIPELLDGNAGLLVPPDDPGALADALARLAAEPELRAGLAESGRRRIAEEFEAGSVARRLSQLFETAAAVPPVPDEPQRV
jgi:colanic acid/amylovoran biosynthesis glycosyltransferase